MPNLAVFSTSVEVFPQLPPHAIVVQSLLHVRGGVSKSFRMPCSIKTSSPRPWRCFRLLAIALTLFVVFSTSVEVFLKFSSASSNEASLLHVRGGVSQPTEESAQPLMSSPRPWRCFLEQDEKAAQKVVFSTSVEVFLRQDGD